MKKWAGFIKTWMMTYKRYLVIASLSGILLTVVGVGLFHYRLSNIFDKALTYYEVNDLMSFETIRYELYAMQGKKFDEFLIQEAEKTLNQFKHNEITYYEAIGTTKRIESFANRSSNIEIYQEKIEKLKESRKAFEKAEAYAIEKDWESAYQYYQQVVDWDPNYEKSKQLAESAKRWWLQDILVEAITSYEEGNYEQALLKIDEGLALSPDHETFLDLKDDVHQAMIDGETENKWTEFKDKITSSIQSGIESLHNIFNKIFKTS